MNCTVAGIKNHNCLESDIFPATDSFITLRSINSFRLESGNMEKIIIDTIIDYYVNKRLNSTEISNILGIKNTAILHQLKKNGIPRRDSNKYRMEKIYTKELIDVIVDYYVNKQLNSTEISNILGIKKAAIKTHFPAILSTIKQNNVCSIELSVLNDDARIIWNRLGFTEDKPNFFTMR